ncbi:FecR family protein [Mesoflavibacter zeaxanthinifaciens]|uniref:FecR family protein n=1 Tax=Mesoflavibacter zeaxanthinifaciens TaxID=393060 RepID=UPI0026EAEE05|nr:FecR family protein [Mesoflavibacter zeaxanthinifaciens]
MEKEYLIKKWLDNSLTPEELDAFKALEDYEALTKLSNYTKGFKAPEYNEDEALKTVLHQIETKKQSKTNWLQPVLKIASILVLCFGAYYYTTTLDTTFTTDFSEKITVDLPDNSKVNLNALSSITFNKSDWKNNRNITLKGEAFFDVEKGSSFNVNTTTGTVTVLGTEFNVKQRDNFFEVTCYEGLVLVTYKNNKTKIKPGESFLVLNDLVINNKTDYSKPQWLSNTSAFKSLPLKEVIAEFERQYNVKVEAKNINTDLLFTGRFTHDNLDLALKSITQPLQLTYKKSNQTIILKRE